MKLGLGDLDVVVRLADHQHDLPSRPRVAVIGLPLPPICAALGVAECFAAARARELDELAEDVGGGDGKAVLLDLDADTRPIDEIFRTLAGSGVEELVLHGSRDQPGFARAFSLRWQGTVRPAPRGRDSAIAALMDDPAPVLELGDGVVRLRGRGAEPPPNARVALVGLDRHDDLHAAAPEGHLERRAYALDPARTLAPWSGFVPPAAARGPAVALREAWCERFLALGFEDAVRCASFGLDPVLEARLRGSAAPPPSQQRPLILAMSGIDGSGKSTHAAALTAALTRRHLSARTLKIHRQSASLELAGELPARARAGAPLAALRVARIVKLVDSIRALRDDIEPASSPGGALILDRYAETHLAAARVQLGWDLEGHPALTILPPAAMTFLLDLDPDFALTRIAARTERPSAEELEIGLHGYAGELTRLAATAPGRWVRLDARAPTQQNQQTIEGVALGLADAARISATPGAPSPLLPNSPPTLRRNRGGRALLVIGGAPGACAMGGDALALCDFARTRLGAAAGGFPEAFWVEAYAAQIVLDLRAIGGDRARVALWPAALARTGFFSDLVMIEELERMALSCCEIEGYVPGGGAAAIVAASTFAPATSEALAAAYGRALDDLAVERGWHAFR